ncbi:MAG: Ig-like domain-containing protein [Gemmatimonadaceae bacterium]|nr:Ig-like domain-containing protein [Gemmatimonadaceae bacterium]
MPHHRLRTAALSLLFVLSACRKDSTTGPSATATSIRVSDGQGQTGTVGVALSAPLRVVVTDAGGKVVSGARVDWDAGAGGGSVSPSSVNTNSDGIATATWTLGTVAGALRVTAQVFGLNPVVFNATALPGAAATVVATPDRAFLGQGDTVRIRATARDQFGNDISGQTITFSSPDPAIATATSTGLVTGVGQGTGRIIADAGTRSVTVSVTVGAPGSSACGPTAPRALAVGEVFTPDADPAGVRACLNAPVGVNAEYALTLISTIATFSTLTPIDAVINGNTATTTAVTQANVALADYFGAPAAALAPTSDASATDPTEPARLAELERRATERRELAALVEGARAWQRERAAFPSLAIPTNIKVGDAITLNANATQACTSPNNRVSRVAAIGEKSIVVADNENPSGGYSDTEYASIAATFDTLIYPLDTTAFGAPTNVGGVNKIILFYTRAVNALTPTNTSSFTIGGFFFARDLYPKTARNGFAACAGSNEAEMFYLLVPDPNGTVNNNRRTKDAVTTLNLGTIAHEFEHLINSGRRLYVNSGAVVSEETWLDEGLAHTAEELLYYRMSGFGNRQNLNLTQVASQSTLFSNFASQNFSRFYAFLINPEGNSPYAPNDSLSTRGASWNFLRFAAGRQSANGGEAVFYRSVVNSLTSGRNNLANVLGGQTQLADYLRDWTVSLMADDFSTAVTSALDARYIVPAWNFRSIYPGLRLAGGNPLGVYPLNTRLLTTGVPQRISLAGGTSSYVRFSIASGRSALVSLASNGTALPTAMRYAIVRVR